MTRPILYGHCHTPVWALTTLCLNYYSNFSLGSMNQHRSTLCALPTHTGPTSDRWAVLPQGTGFILIPTPSHPSMPNLQLPRKPSQPGPSFTDAPFSEFPWNLGPACVVLLPQVDDKLFEGTEFQDLACTAVYTVASTLLTSKWAINTCQRIHWLASEY